MRGVDWEPYISTCVLWMAGETAPKPPPCPTKVDFKHIYCVSGSKLVAIHRSLDFHRMGMVVALMHGGGRNDATHNILTTHHRFKACS